MHPDLAKVAEELKYLNITYNLTNKDDLAVSLLPYAYELIFSWRDEADTLVAVLYKESEQLASWIITTPLDVARAVSALYQRLSRDLQNHPDDWDERVYKPLSNQQKQETKPIA